MSAVVSDTSPLHYLIECDCVTLLQALFGEVVIPPTVFAELQHPRTPPIVRDWIAKHPAWLKVQTPRTVDDSLNVDRGEKEAISLAREISAVVILIDDRKGRIEAVRHGLRVAGTIGILELAASRGLIRFPPAIQKLKTTGARIDEELINAAANRLSKR